MHFPWTVVVDVSCLARSMAGFGELRDYEAIRMARQVGECVLTATRPVLYDAGLVSLLSVSLFACQADLDMMIRRIWACR